MPFLTQKRSKKKTISSQVSSSVHFKDVLTKVGISFQDNNGPNIFLKQQPLIVRDLIKELEQHPSYPNNIQEFMIGLKDFLQNEGDFKKALLPSELQYEYEDETMTHPQENVIRLFLTVDCLQSDMISLILDEVTTHAVKEEENTIWLRLLFGPLRWMPYIKEPETLAKRLLEILEVATFPSQLEILNFIPDIIPDSEYDATGKHLSKLLNENSQLVNAIIDCLNYLNLSTETKEEIQDRVLAILNSTSSLKTFPAIFCFLVNDGQSKELPNILLKTRNALDSIMNSVHCENEQVLTFEEIRTITVNSRIVADAWIHNIRTASDHKSVDLIILLILHGTGSHRKSLIESIFKKKIKKRQLKCTLLELTLQKYLVPQLLKEYMKSILEMGGFLLRLHSEPLYLEFAQVFYITTFGHKHADKQHRQQILNALILATGNADVNKKKNSVPALTILLTISQQHFELLQPHTSQLMTLLDKLEETDLNEVRQIFDLLCGLTCGPRADHSMDMFQNNIHMIVRKQISSSKKSLKYRGIIAAVASAKYIATVFNQSDDLPLGNDSSNSISELPAGAGKQAATILELVNASTSSCPIAQALYFDQLAQMMFSSEHLDNIFMSWLFDLITNHFQDIYITDTRPEFINDIPISIKYNLNSTDEIEQPIYVNIASLTMHSSQNNNNMLVFAPLFRLLRLIHHRQHDGNLSTIDALLGCGIAMPEIDPDCGVDTYDTDQSKQVVDCLFHCINWFREIISAFVTQKGKKLKEKVLNRLKQLVELELLFIQCIQSVPDHKLPPCYFYNINLDSSVTFNETVKRKRPAAAAAANPNTTTRTIITQQATPAATTSKAKKTQSKEKKEVHHFQFREIDTDIIILLKYPLNIDEESSITENSLSLSLAQYKFIMNDLVMKLGKLNNKATSTFTHLITVKSDDLIKDCVRLMPHINKHLIKIIDEIKKLLERSDGIHDAHEMFLPPATELKLALSLTFEVLSLVFHWTGFQSNKNLPLLRDCLRALVDETSSQLNSAQRLIMDFLKCLIPITDYCLTLASAVNLINIVKAICNVSTDPTPAKKLTLLSGKLLSKKWFNMSGLSDTGAAANLHLDNLVKAHLNGSNIETISNIVLLVQNESNHLKSKDDSLETFPSINKQNFPILYRGLCATLLEALQSDLQDSTNLQHLEIWHNTVATLRSLMEIVKREESRTNLVAFFKKSMALLKIFLSQGLPILEILLKSHSQEVIEIMRTLQQTTRFMHNLCCHSKVTKDSSLIAHVPPMRLALETLVYRVKAALIANDCSAAFWMGNLRNKNLQGQEILSQSTNTTQSSHNNDDDDDELPPDDDDSDTDTIHTALTEPPNDSASEIF